MSEKCKCKVETISENREKSRKIVKNEKKIKKNMFFKNMFGTFLVTNSNKMSKKVPINIFIFLRYRIS